MYFLGLFELLSLLFKQLNAYKAYILLLHMFSQFVTLTRVRVTHFTHSRRDVGFLIIAYLVTQKVGEILLSGIVMHIVSVFLSFFSLSKNQLYVKSTILDW